MKSATATEILHPVLMSSKDVARYLGIGYQSLMHGDMGTLCLNEYRRKVSGCVLFIAEQVEDHAARLLAYQHCDGSCKKTAERVIREARERITGNVLAAVA